MSAKDPRYISGPDALEQERDRLRAIAQATLLFHQAGPWTDEDTARWHGLLNPILGDGPHEVTTKVLCGAARVALAKDKA